MSDVSFENDLDAIRSRFNQTFEDEPLCNPDFRARVVLAIVHMGILCRRINIKKRKEDVREFLTVKNKLNDFFSKLAQEKERRLYPKK